MKVRIIINLFFVIIANNTFAQLEKMPVIKANSKTVHIRDGENYTENAWTISPEINPDVYTTNNNTVTFYTDIDSIFLIIVPNKTLKFIIVLNGKDSAITQVKFEKKKLELTYLQKLKKANLYNVNDTRATPSFSYQSSENPNLKALRKAFNLDSIAGNGNETTQVLNLLHWIHNLIPHDGNHQNPIIKNAMSMITECKKGNKTLNCRGLATVLNECYLALGFKSRFVTCLPKDTSDVDCHVINTVWMPSLKRWIWIDPTNNAYVMNEKGELLSIAEVRERLINGKTLLLNPDANWNNKSTVVKEEYLYNYMAKNLYRIECPVYSQYDAETKLPEKQITYIELLPLNADNQTPQRIEHKNAINTTVFINYKTNNNKVFWVNPN